MPLGALCTFQAACPCAVTRKPLKCQVPQPGQIRGCRVVGMSGNEEGSKGLRAPCRGRSREQTLALHPGRASRPCPFIQAALTEAIGVPTDQKGSTTVLHGRKVAAPLAV